VKKEEEEILSKQDSQNEVVSFLLRLAGARPAIPADVKERVHEAVRVRWQQSVRSRVYKRRIFAFALPAAALFCLYVFGMHFIVSGIPKSVPLGFVENLNGSVFISADPKNGSTRPLVKGETLMTGARLETGDSSRLLFHVLGGGTFRLDVKSRLYLKSESSLVLDRGRVYIDSEKRNHHFVLLTDMGAVRDIGTQFEVQMNPGTIRIRVREGLVSLDRSSTSNPASEGTELSMDRRGKTSVRNIPKYGPQWDWLSEVAPTFHMEGQTLMEFLKWVSRENGWTLKFENPKIQQTAFKTVLHGSLNGISPQETPDVVLPVCGLSYSLREGVFTTTSKKTE
jgi:FecR protein